MDNALDLIQNLLNLNDNLVWTASLDGKLTYANPALARIFGRPVTDFLRNPRLWQESILPEDQGQLNINLLLERGQAKVEYRIINASGQIRWLLEHRHLIFDETGQPIGIGGIAADITDRQEIEARMRADEARYRAIVEEQPEFMVVFWQTDGVCTFVNEAFCRYFQQPREQLIGHSILPLTHPEDRAPMLRQLTQLTPDNPVVTGIYRLLRAGGAVSWQERTDRAVFDDQGNILEIQSVGKDITPRKQAQDALKRQTEFLQTIIDNIPIMIAFRDASSRLTLVNQDWERVSGWTSQEAQAHPDILLELYPDPAYRQTVVELMSSAQPGWHDLKITTRPGQVIDTAWAFVNLSDGTQIAIGQDISELKQMEEQLYQAQKMESIGRLAGGIAHDFNNLLVPIMGYAELGMMALSPDNKLHAHLTQIQKAAARAASLTRQILAFSRRQILEMELLDLNTVILEFETMLQRLIGEDVDVHTFLVPSLCLIKADKSQIEQILLNLAVNARDAMPGGGKLTIETANVFLDEAYVKKYADAQAPGPYVMLAVSDTGHGMDAATKNQIFEPFFTTKERGKGTGLGLATVFGIVKQHQGNIWVYSEPGGGTTFKIYLPQAKDAPRPLQPVPAALTSLFGTETILLVEDEAMLREMVCETLEAYGYRVLEAAEPEAALETARSYTAPIHLLLTDVIMPKLDGRALSQQITIVHPETRVLYMSGYTDNVIVHHNILDEGVNFLQKPFTLHTLTQKIRRSLE